MMLTLLALILMTVDGIFSADTLEGEVKFVFKPLGGERTIQVPSGNRIAVELKIVNLAPYERLTIFDGPCDLSTPVLFSRVRKGEILEIRPNITLFSTAEVVCIRYMAHTIPGAVLIAYRAFPRCQGTMNLQSGDIVNPSYPGSSPHEDEHCKWNVEVEDGQRMHVQVRDLDATSVTIAGILGKERKVTLTKQTPREFSTERSSMTVENDAGAESEGRGFWIHYEAIGCPKKLLAIPRNGLWSPYGDYITFGQVVYMRCKTGYKFPSGAGSSHYGMTCQKDRTWTRSWEGELEDCVEA